MVTFTFAAFTINRITFKHSTYFYGNGKIYERNGRQDPPARKQEIQFLYLFYWGLLYLLPLLPRTCHFTIRRFSLNSARSILLLDQLTGHRRFIVRGYEP